MRHRNVFTRYDLPDRSQSRWSAERVVFSHGFPFSRPLVGPDISLRQTRPISRSSPPKVPFYPELATLAFSGQPYFCIFLVFANHILCMQILRAHASVESTEMTTLSSGDDRKTAIRVVSWPLPRTTLLDPSVSKSLPSSHRDGQLSSSSRITTLPEGQNMTSDMHLSSDRYGTGSRSSCFRHANRRSSAGQSHVCSTPFRRSPANETLQICLLILGHCIMANRHNVCPK